MQELTTDLGVGAPETQQPPEAVEEPPCFTSHLPHPSTTVATVVTNDEEDKAELVQHPTMKASADEVSSSPNTTVTTTDNAGNREWSQTEPIAEYYSAGEDAEVAGLTVGEEKMTICSKQQTVLVDAQDERWRWLLIV